MPRTALPPTPSSSTDIRGKDGPKDTPNLQLAFELPPPAMNSAGGSKMKTPESPVPQTSSKTPYPIQPSEAVKSRKRSAAAAPTASSSGNKDSFALPPPPTRSRKIIQMKPRTQDAKKPAEVPATSTGRASTTPSRKLTAAIPAVAPAVNEASSSKKKQPSATSVAGRKIARKTAHSLIERRRRSKMNEEFAVLKNMIPACTGEMHKLAILQASIEYVRYLQDCVEKLKAQRADSSLNTPTYQDDSLNEKSNESYEPDREYHQTAFTPEEEQYSPDVEMTGSDVASSPTFASYPSSVTNASHQSTESPNIPAQDAAMSPAIHRHGSYSSVSTAFDHNRHYSFSTATASPALGPQPVPLGAGWYAHSSHSASGSTLTSPALGPMGERDLDQEATAALLMLNNDRRGTISTFARDAEKSGGNRNIKGKPRGMSVRDLLSA